MAAFVSKVRVKSVTVKGKTLEMILLELMGLRS